MFTPKINLFAILLLVSFMSPSGVYAAKQGLLGAESIGSINIRIHKPQVMRIEGVSDAVISYEAIEQQGATWKRELCIHSTQPGDYYLSANATTNNNGQFAAKADSSSIPYSLAWHNLNQHQKNAVKLVPSKATKIVGSYHKKQNSCGQRMKGTKTSLIIDVPKVAKRKTSKSHTEVVTLFIAMK